MPRAFLITRRRFDGEIEETAREYSPERVVRLGEYGCGQQATSDGASECGSESSTSDCPEELYNLTKLAEVSLAAAAGTLYHHPQQSVAERSRALFFERIESERESLVELKTRRPEQPQALRQPDAFDVQFKTDLPDPLAVPSPTPLTVAAPRPAAAQRERPPSPQAHQAAQAAGQAQEAGEEHECPDCGKRYSTSSNLARHRQTHRSLGDKKARRCPHCDKVYVSIPAFSMHVRTHNQGCKCHYCGKCFSRPWLLQGHIRTHTGEKPFKCTICNKAFADKSNLRAHIQTHSNTKPHVCSRCGKAFALKSYLYKHEESSCMRSHQQQQQQPTAARERRESSTSPRPQPPPPQQQQQQSATPTSVIVRPAELSRMVIRTSVISPNPEHLARFAEKQQHQAQPPPQQQQQPQQTRQPFDFNDPTRVSAFSRPQPMTLNLAIA